ncbi:MAG: rRNA maturation RNase YbeY [Anaerolineae bacterium]|nr:rRNA maturation RNase YbeY [Anaerolineae bacterium]
MDQPAADMIQIDSQVDEEFAAEVDVAQVEAAARRALALVNLSEAVELSIVVTSDETLRELNRTYRGQDKVTDVLSFGQDGDDLILPPDLPRLLGDVVVAYPRVVVQAARAGWTPGDELAWLVIHGVLHLLGYDDETEEGRAEMWALGEQALGRAAPLIRDEDMSDVG